MPVFVDTGLNIAHVDDVAAGHILAYKKGQIGERYILGGTDMELSEILAYIARFMDRNPPTIKIPHNVILPVAYLAEAWARITGGDNPFVVVDGVKMAKKKMFFSSAKAQRDLGYIARPAGDALDDAIRWFQSEGYF
jgi:dihydroflavonol-4-reductase